MLFQENKIQSGINKVVNSKNSNEIPSIPIDKFIFNKGINKNLFINWNLEEDLSKNIHKKRKPINEKQLKSKAINFNTLFSLVGTNISNKIAIIGRNIFNIRMFFNIKLYFIRFELIFTV